MLLLSHLLTTRHRICQDLFLNLLLLLTSPLALSLLLSSASTDHVLVRLLVPLALYLALYLFLFIYPDAFLLSLIRFLPLLEQFT